MKKATEAKQKTTSKHLNHSPPDLSHSLLPNYVIFFHSSLYGDTF